MVTEVKIRGALDSVKNVVRFFSIVEKYYDRFVEYDVNVINIVASSSGVILTYDVEYEFKDNEVALILPKGLTREVFNESFKFALEQVEIFNRPSGIGVISLLFPRIFEIHRREVSTDTNLYQVISSLSKETLKSAVLVMLKVMDFIEKSVLKSLALEKVNKVLLKPLIISGLNLMYAKKITDLTILNIIADNCWRTSVDPQYADKLISLNYLGRQILEIYNLSLQAVKNPSHSNVVKVASELTNLLR